MIAADVETALRAAGVDRLPVRTVLSPAWTTDWMSQEGRRKLREYGIAPPGACQPAASGPRPIGLTLSAQVPALRVHQDQGDQPIRFHPLQVAVVLPGLRRTLRLLQGDLMTIRLQCRQRHRDRRTGPETRQAGPDRTARTPARGVPPAAGRLAWTGSPRTRWRSPSTCRTSCATSSGSTPASTCPSRPPPLGDDVRRNYSICAPATGGPLRIGVKRIPEGVFSSYAADQLQAGDVLDVMTPSGTFSTPLDPANAKRYVAVAAGSGITPVLSILATVLEVEPQSTAALIYVNRRTSTIMFLEELEDLKNRFPERFQLVHVLGQEMTEVEMLSGRLDVERLGRILDTIVPVDDVDEWFLCGPLAMTDSVRGVLLERDVDTAHVHRELFHVGAPSPAAARSPTRPPRSRDPRSPSSSTAGR